MEKGMQDRAVKAACRFVEHRGMEVICPDGFGAVDIVAIDNGDIVFIKVAHSEMGGGGVPDSGIGRDDFEATAVSFLAQGDRVNCAVRMDMITMLTVGDDRALVRYHANVTGNPCWG